MERSADADSVYVRYFLLSQEADEQPVGIHLETESDVLHHRCLPRRDFGIYGGSMGSDVFRLFCGRAFHAWGVRVPPLPGGVGFLLIKKEFAEGFVWDRFMPNKKKKKKRRKNLFKGYELDQTRFENDEDRDFAVKVENVSMKFSMGLKQGRSSIKDVVIMGLLPTMWKKRQQEKDKDAFWALTDINLELKKGDRLGILGLNGAGKSTLLKTIAGVYRPTTGRVRKKGVLAPLLELGAGFELQYTARENIFLYGAVLGYRREFIEEKFDEIIEFSGLQKFVDVPIQNYSSGMRTRLGFAICTAVKPDILILDEVFSVGDAKFRRKSEQRIIEMFDTNVTVLFVSHNLGQVMRICNKAIILDHGKLIAEGNIDEVAPIYEQMTGEIRQIRQAAKAGADVGSLETTPTGGPLSKEQMDAILEKYRDFD